MPSAAVLERRRTSQESRLADTATVLRVGDRTRTAGGGFAGSETEQATYPCRVLQPRQPQEQLAGGRPTAEEEWIILLPYDADVRPSDIIRVGERRFQVVETDKGYSGAVLLNATCRRSG